MSKVSKISVLLNSDMMKCSNITQMLADIVTGNMLDGLRGIADMQYASGYRKGCASGLAQGVTITGLAVVGVGAIYQLKNHFERRNLSLTQEHWIEANMRKNTNEGKRKTEERYLFYCGDI